MMSHSFLCRRIVLLTADVYSRNQEALYTNVIGIMKRFQKSVRLSVCNANKNAYFSIIINSRRAWHPLQENKAILKKNMYFHKNASSIIVNSRIIIHILDKRVWNPLQESDIFKKCFRNFRPNFLKFIPIPPSLLLV